MLALAIVSSSLLSLPGQMPAVPLTLGGAVERSLEANFQFLASQQDSAGAEAGLAKAQAAYFPTLSGSLGVNSSGPYAGTFAPSLSLSWDLGTDGSRNNQIAQAKDQAELARLTVDQQRLQLVLSVTNAYYDLQSAEEQVAIQKTAVRNAKASLIDASAMQQAGMSTKFDTERAQTQLAGSQQGLVSAEGQLEIARSTLDRTLGWALDTPVKAIDPVTPAGTWSYSLADSDRLAIANRPEIRQARLRQDLADLGLDDAYAAIVPKTGVSASLSGAKALQANPAQPGSGLASPFGGQGSVGVEASFPIFAGPALNASVAQSKAGVKAAAFRERDARWALGLQVEQAYQQLSTSYLNIATSARALDTSRDALDSARERFKAGVGTQTDVINAENDYTTSQGNHLKAVLDYDRALASLRNLTERP